MNLNNIPFGELQAFNVIVEVEQGSNLKYEYSPETGEIHLDFVFNNVKFPFSYGSIAKTLGGDGDPLDAMIVASKPYKTGTVVKCKVIGMLEAVDRGEVDNKLVVVPLEDPLALKYQDVTDLPPDSLQTWTAHWQELARQKNKIMEIKGLVNKQRALEEIKKSLV